MTGGTRRSPTSMTCILLALLTAASAATGGARADVLPTPASIDGATLGEFEEQRAAIDSAWSNGGRTERFEQPYGPPYVVQRRRHDAREGFLFSIGIGGGQLRVSGAEPDGTAALTGAFDFAMRMGYGFSDRFQLFGDITADVGTFGQGSDVTNWVLSVRGQTVLIGDRAGNGLNVNAGVGLGGLSITNWYAGFHSDTPASVAFVGGLSYDARIARQFALSPELYFMWHPVSNGPGFADDSARSIGLRLNFLWYAP
jgi:hypothetical protein